MTLVKVSRETLLKPLQSVAGIIERRQTLPILSNVLLVRSATKLEFVASDIEIEISASIAVDSGEERSVTVGARKFLDILRALPEGADIQTALQDKRMQVRSAKSRFSLQTLPAEDFPRMAAPEGDAVRFTLPQKVLKSLFALVQYSMAQQDIRYYLNGLLMVVEGGELRVVATDGHRLAYATRQVVPMEVGKQEVILPRKTVLELTRLMSDGDEGIEIQLSSNQARFSFGDTVVVSKLIDGKFPDYNRVIPKLQNRIIKIKRAVIQQALQRAAILTNDKFRGVRWILSENSLRVSCSNTEQEEAQEELDIEYTGEALDVGFNVSYLLDVLNHLTVDEVQWALGDANSSALLTIPGQDDFKYVVMPMRI
jgi:DNA polymerase III subunit beta